MSGEALQTLDQQYIANTYARFDVVFVRGKGCFLFDDKGKRYIDMGSGIAVSGLGYGDKAWAKAVCDQAKTLSHACNLYYTQPQTQLARVLCERTGMKKVFFTNSGAEANECLIKAARKYAANRHGENKKPVILTLTGSFHGRTLATLAATGQESFHHDFGPFPEGFVHIPPNDIPALEAALWREDVCALLLETIQGEGGVAPLTAEYLQAARSLTEERDILLLLDEVQTGNGRTGMLYSYQHFEILPDAFSTAKGLAGGLPMGACLLGEKLEDTLTPGSHGSTFGGNPVCAAGALAVLESLTQELLLEVRAKGEYIRRELETAPGILGVTGQGLMLGIEIHKDAREVVKMLLTRGVVALTAKNRLRLLPPLTIPWKELKKAVNQIKEVVAP